MGAGGIRLSGVVTLPAAAPGGGAVPGVLIVPGLGALDHDAVAAAGTPDGANDALSSSLNPSSPGSVDPLYRDLAQALAQAGVASFRYDKRGTAASRVQPAQRLSLADEVADARAALAFLLLRREVGTSPGAVLGHDVGGLVALEAAAGDSRVRAAVLVSTPGRPLADVLADDFARSRGTTLANQLRAAVASLQATGRVPAADTLAPLVRPEFPTGADAYLTSLFALDPVADARSSSLRALLVRGAGDRTVSAADNDRISPAFGAGADLLVSTADADHNLAVIGTAGPAVRQRDHDTAERLAAWVKAALS